ncbi:hypothetical protein ACWZEH_30290 [Streptomyces sp. QTS137]
MTDPPGPTWQLTLDAFEARGPSEATALLRPPDRFEGIAWMTDVVERRERGPGPEHPFTAASRHLLDAYRSGRRRR